jgi:YHS domain-containing protein
VLAAFLLVTLFAVTVMAQTRTTRRPRRTGVKAQDKATTATLPMGEKGKKEGEVGKTHGTMMRKQTRCPVRDGNKIDKKCFSDQDGKRVYFCSSACKKEFEKNPTKYMKQMKDRGIELEKTPLTKGK